MVWRFSESVGLATNNVAEYRGVLLGIKQAFKKGFIDSVQGYSNLVCVQIQGKWKLKNPNIVALGNEAKELKNKFRSFEIRHTLREFNSEADALAHQAVQLRDSGVDLLCIWASARVFDHRVVRHHLRLA
ncbi:unnamed protein product [Linum trigynum]|uniref:RNase H type-1 domain-containing protein n=1 Tax=Linum trigynum TaxID=586398 RepID=A0AAV2DU89_9ROSI